MSETNVAAVLARLLIRMFLLIPQHGRLERNDKNDRAIAGLISLT